MRVYLVQHGKAKPAEEDPSRGLTGEGYAEVKQVADFLAGLRITVSLIQHSGKKRAEETAHLLATSIRWTAGPCHTTGLDPSDDPSVTANFLKVYTDDVLIVGHLPHLERLTSLLLTGCPGSPSGEICQCRSRLYGKTPKRNLESRLGGGARASASADAL